jgi:hypothetical protein
MFSAGLRNLLKDLNLSYLTFNDVREEQILKTSLYGLHQTYGR